MNTVTGRLRILLVWDDVAMATAVMAALVAAGYEVQHVADSLSGLTAVETWRPGLVILNWNQPLIGGAVFLFALQTGLDVPPRVIVLADDGQVVPARWPAVAGTVTKPFTTMELVQLVGTLSVDGPSSSADYA